MVEGSGATRQPDEYALVERAIQGDAEAFGALYALHLEAIYRYVYFRVGDETEAEDLTEEVFVRVWEALPDYAITGHPFTSWVYRIAHNLIIDHRRKRRPEPVEDEMLANLPSQAATPEEVVVQQQELRRLTAAVRQLGEEEQQVVILRFVQGLSHREVAEILGKSEVASRVILHRALNALARILRWSEASHG